MHEVTTAARTNATGAAAGSPEERNGSPVPPSRGHVGRVLATSVALLGGGLLLAALSGTVALAVLAVLVIHVAGLARHVGWRMAAAMTLLAAMVAQVCFLRLTPALGWDVGRADLVGWALVGLAGMGVLAVSGVPTVSRAQLETLAFVMVVPVVGVAAYAVRMLSSGGSWIGWAMSNDVAFRSLMVRWTLDDHGLRAARGYSDPLTTALQGAWSANAAGSGGGVSDAVRAIVYSDAQLWILLWLAVSAVCSLIALRRAGSGPVQRAAIAVLAGLMPWTWFVSGSGFELGFQNVASSVLVVLLAWVLWTHREDHPSASLAGLLLATLATAMAWAPLALIPLAWAAHTVVTERAALWNAPLRARLLPVGVLLLGITYGAAVTIPETLASGTGGLSGDGAIQAVEWKWVLALTLVGTVVSVVFRNRLSRTHRWGLWLAVSASALVTAYLLYQRRDSTGLWGYYPIKFVWLAVSAALLIAFAETGAALSRLRPWGRAAGVVVAAVVALVLMAQITPPWAPGSRFTPVALTQNERNDRAAADLFKILETHPKSFVSAYSKGPWTGAQSDGFINFWLFQISAASADDPIRNLAYHFDPADVPTACREVAVWGTGVELWTRKRSVARAYARSCPAGQVEIRLRGRLQPVNR